MRTMRWIRVPTTLVIALALAAGLAGAARSAPALPGTELPVTITGRPGPGMFLVAKRSLDGTHFGQTVVYLVKHGGDGSLGLIVNRLSDVSLSEAVPDIEDEQASAHALYYGGPVGLPMIVMLARGQSGAEGMSHVADGVYASTERRALEDLLAARKPANAVRFYLGYSGWAADQLDFELLRGSWHVIPADTDAIFSEDTDSLWEQYIDRLEPMGIQVDNRPEVPAMGYTTADAQGGAWKT